MKCLTCHCHFEPTAEERRMRMKQDVSADFPYCSLECSKADKSNAWRKGKIPRELYHVGAKDPAPTFGEGCTVLVLPSAKFYNAKTNKSHLANDRHN